MSEIDRTTQLKVRARAARKEGRHLVRRGRVRFGQIRRRLASGASAGETPTVLSPNGGPSAVERETWTPTPGAEVVHLPATTTAAEVAAELTASGAVIVDNLITPEVVDRFLTEMDPWIEATPFGADDFKGHRTKRTGALVARSETVRELVVHPLVLGAVGRMLGHANAYRLHLTQVISVGGGEPAQKIHRDQWIFDDFPFPPGYEVQCNTIWALDDFTDENGATRVIPGSNRAADRARFSPRHTVPAAMTKGSVLFYTGSVYHGGGANLTRSPRRGLNLTYNLGWLRQEENQYLAVPPELARTLPVELLRVLGYQLGAGLLGYVGDVTDPLVALGVDAEDDTAN